MDQHHQDVIPATHRIFQHLIKGRALVPPFGSAETLVFVGLDDQPATMICHPLKNEPLVFRGLVVAAHAQIDRGAHATGVYGSVSGEQETMP